MGEQAYTLVQVLHCTLLPSTYIQTILSIKVVWCCVSVSVRQVSPALLLTFAGHRYIHDEWSLIEHKDCLQGELLAWLLFPIYTLDQVQKYFCVLVHNNRVEYREFTDGLTDGMCCFVLLFRWWWYSSPSPAITSVHHAPEQSVQH